MSYSSCNNNSEGCCHQARDQCNALVLRGPRGRDGSRGPRGCDGKRGRSGSPGCRGHRGATGASGLQGITGATGLTGASGVTGPSGVSGLIGATGISGLIGATGISGLIGATGPGIGWTFMSSGNNVIAAGAAAFIGQGDVSTTSMYNVSQVMPKTGFITELRASYEVVSNASPPIPPAFPVTFTLYIAQAVLNYSNLFFITGPTVTVPTFASIPGNKGNTNAIPINIPINAGDIIAVRVNADGVNNPIPNQPLTVDIWAQSTIRFV